MTGGNIANEIKQTFFASIFASFVILESAWSTEHQTVNWKVLILMKLFRFISEIIEFEEYPSTRRLFFGLFVIKFKEENQQTRNHFISF